MRTKAAEPALPLVHSHSLVDRTFKTLDFYRKHQDNMTPAGLAFFQCQWDESVTDTFHNTLGESHKAGVVALWQFTKTNSTQHASSFAEIENVFLSLDNEACLTSCPCRHEGTSVWVHPAPSVPPSAGQVPQGTAPALPGQIQRWKGAHLWNILIDYETHTHRGHTLTCGVCIRHIYVKQ